jgi:two-component system NtrC family sensor kinase
MILRSKVRVFLELDMARRRLQSAYQELQKTQSQLVQSAKMASLGELVAGVAHEINNPLAFSVSHLETARRSLSRIETELPAEALSPVRQYWDRAQNRLGEMGMGLERIRELVVKLRSFSRLDEGERKRVNIKECVDSVLTILGHRLKEPLQVETHFSDPAMLDCYPGLLNQAVMNLVANAIDAIEGPGRIVIRAGEESGKYVISVSDTGKGIPGDLRDRVLEPFFTTKPVGQGTGLGLSITYSIVEKHGGSLELASPEQGGTCAVMRLPLTQQGRP